MILDAHSVAAVLGGEVTGRDRVLAPGPGHSAADRSLSILISATAPGGLLVTSHAGDDWRDCRDHVFRRLGVSPEVRVKSEKPPIGGFSADEADRTARAVQLWREAVDPRRTPVDAYFRSRGLALPPEACGEVLRWHPACPFGPGIRTGAMIALVRDVVTNEARAIHRTAISGDGAKRSDLGSNGRLTLGPVAGGAVKLTPDADVTTMLGLGEGIESSLSLRRIPEFGRSPVWALLSAGQVSRFPLLPGIETLWIAADHDPAGLRATEAAAEHWRSREVLVVTPRRLKADLNDVVMEASHAA